LPRNAVWLVWRNCREEKVDDRGSNSRPKAFRITILRRFPDDEQ